MSGTWKYFDLAIVIGAVIIGCAVWFIPDMMSTPKMKELVANANERKERIAAYQAQQAEIKREQEELGLVFLPPPPAEQKVAPKKDK
jgi:hypothetical protein